MDTAVSPLNLGLQPPAGGVSAVVVASGGVDSGATSKAGLFAALLAGQLSQEVAAGLTPEFLPVPVPVAETALPAATDVAGLLLEKTGLPVETGRSAEKEDTLADAVEPDPALQLQQLPVVAQQAVMPIPVENRAVGGGASTENASPVTVVAGQGAALSSREIAPAQRHSIAAEPAAFAVPEAAVRQDAGKEFMVPVARREMEASPMPGLSSAPSMPMPIVAQVQAPPAQTGGALPAGGTIPPAVGHSAWGESLGDRVVWMVSQQHQGVEMHLNPPSLGPLEVRLSMSDGQASLSFSTQHLPVKEAIESATPRLREMLGESGISLGSVSVNVGSFNQPQSGQNEQLGTPRDSRSAYFPGVEFPSAPVAVTRLSGGRGMVDIFA